MCALNFILFVQMTEAGKQWGFNGHHKWAHGGMLQAALAIRQELEDSHILQKIFGHYASSYDVRSHSTTRETNSLHTVLLSEHVNKIFKLHLMNVLMILILMFVLLL